MNFLHQLAFPLPRFYTVLMSGRGLFQCPSINIPLALLHTTAGSWDGPVVPENVSIVPPHGTPCGHWLCGAF